MEKDKADNSSEPQFNLELLKIIVCPVSHGALSYNAQTSELICKKSSLAYPIRNGIPVLLKEEAREI